MWTVPYETVDRDEEPVTGSSPDGDMFSILQNPRASYRNSLLETRKTRVTLKMDVAFTDHSHVIGKGGRTIQRVMDGTGCHIHFPDSNRTNIYQKSNQVSIAGTAQGAEQARCRVRHQLPVTVHYELPLKVIVQDRMNPACATLQMVQRTYGIIITIRTIGSFRGPFSFGPAESVQVTVRGTRAMLVSLQQGISFVLNFITAGAYEMSRTPAVIETEIATHHHAFVMGRGNSNLREIHQLTGSVVTFPEPVLPQTSYYSHPTPILSRRSNVKIRGPNFDCAYRAWLELMGHLPLLLIFDLPEGRDCDASLVTQLMDQLKVSILIKPKQKRGSNDKSVLVRGPERESRILFEVRRQILNLDQSEVPFCCGTHSTWHGPPLHGRYLPSSYSSYHHQPPGLMMPSTSRQSENRRIEETPGPSYSRTRGRQEQQVETSLTSVINQHREFLRKQLGRLDFASTSLSNDEDDDGTGRDSMTNRGTITEIDKTTDDVFGGSLLDSDWGLKAFERLTISRPVTNANANTWEGNSTWLSKTLAGDCWGLQDRSFLLTRNLRPNALAEASGDEERPTLFSQSSPGQLESSAWQSLNFYCKTYKN